MTDVFEGQCQCGGVTYRVTGQAIALFVCHCADCQRQSASAFAMALWIENPSVQVITGTLSSWVRQTPTGRTMNCQFCPTCGSRLFHQFADQTNIISVKPGTLNDRRRLAPVANIWTDSAQPWVKLDQDCLLYRGNPQSFEEIRQAWTAARSEALTAEQLTKL